MRYSCRSFIGHNLDTSWSQYWEGGSDGQVSCLINISSTSVQLPQVGREILDQLASINSLESLSQIVEDIKNNQDYLDIRICLSVALVDGKTLYVAQLNEGYIYLQRDQSLGLLVEGKIGEIKIINGKIVDADRLLFLSPKFYLSFSQDYLLTTLASSNLSSIEETILSDLVNLDDQDLTSAALIEFRDDEPTEITAPVSESPIVPAPHLAPHQNVGVSHIPVHQTSYRRKLRLIIGIIIFFLLSGSIFYGYRQNQAKTLENKYLALETKIQQSIDQSLKLKPLSLADSLKEAQVAKDLISQAKLLNTHSDKLSAFETTVSSLLSQVGSKEYQPEFFYDTTLIAGKLNYTSLRFFSGKLYLLDSSTSKLYELSSSDKSQKLVSESDVLGNTLDFAVDKVQVTTLKEKSISVIKDGKLSGSLELKDFTPTHFHLWNGSAYFLTADNIYKSAPNNTAFSVPQIWLKPSNKLPVNTTSIAINGSIWTLTSTGAITSYTQGIKDKTIPSLSVEIKNASRLQAAPDYDKLVFTDGDNIVYVYNKAGESVSKYNYGDLKISDIALDPTSNTIFVLCTDQKIYKISL